MYCESVKKTIGMFNVEKNAINEKPPYQREAAVWSVDRQALFLDSLFHGYDVPKLYLHDLRDKKGRYDFAVVDGKQRLTTIWDFLDDKAPLASDFTLPDGSGPRTFSDLSSDWKERFKNVALDVVLIRDANEDDIEELFSRLNNGEPLNASEKRNAIGGAMTSLIREIAAEPFFGERLRFDDKRYQHREIATKFLLIEKTIAGGADMFCELTKRHLDDLVRDNKVLKAPELRNLKQRTKTSLAEMGRVFSAKDVLLSRQAYAPLYYLFVKAMNRDYAHAELFSRLRNFLEWFSAERVANLARAEEKRDAAIDDFDHYMQQGTMRRASLERRVEILRRYFLLQSPDMKFRDPKRAFSEAERIAIWIIGKKKCANCKRALPQFSEMEADHELQWAHGGATTLKNSRALCSDCNLRLAKKVS